MSRRRWRAALPWLAHLPVVAWMLAGPLFEGRVPYFRDILLYYFPNLHFLERALAQGVWPLWNPTSDAGGPFLAAYPFDLALVGLFGADKTLRFDAVLHLTLAMAGASLLARTLGAGPWGTWAAGLFYGCSGHLLSTLNLFEMFHAVAWAPIVIAAAVTAWRTPGPATAAALAVAAAIQVSTLSAETIMQTAFIGLCLLRERPDRRRCAWLAAAGGLAVMLAAPAWLGVHSLLQGTVRGGGFKPADALELSLAPVALLDVVLPRFFGNPHVCTNIGYWGQPFFRPLPQPYLLSLYVGIGVFLLALQPGPSLWKRRLWFLFGLGLLLALGAYGPFRSLLPYVLSSFRYPVKFFFTANLALCLLAAQGFERTRDGARRSWEPLWYLPGLAALSMYPVLAAAPTLPSDLFGRFVPELLRHEARGVIASSWPLAFGTAGALWAGAMLVLRTPRLAFLAPVLVACDLMIANQPLNPFADRAFYELRAPVKAMVDRAKAEGDHRWFSYPVMFSDRVTISPELARVNSDAWLGYLDRQSLVSRSNVIDGLDSVFDIDRVGLAPAGSTVRAEERFPGRFRAIYDRLRLASVRWVSSFEPLPADLVTLREQVRIPEVAEPFGLYELPSPLPRAFWVRSLEEASAVAEGAKVDYRRPDPHTWHLRVAGPRGYVVVTEGFSPAWQAVDAAGKRRTLTPANGRYWAVATEGGSEEITVRYSPRWRGPALASTLAALLAVFALLVRGARSRVAA